MPTLSEAFPTIAQALAIPIGRRPVVPSGPSRFEALVALLASRTPGSNRGDRLASALAESGFLDPEALASADLNELTDTLRDARAEAPASTLRQIQRVAAWYQSRRDELEDEADVGEGLSEARRDELAGINGIGRATADAIALRIFGASAYPVDRATYRIFVRHGWIDATADYDEVASLIVGVCRDDPAALEALSRGMADIGRRFCKPAAPRCERCPLRTVLPPGGPIEAGE